MSHTSIPAQSTRPSNVVGCYELLDCLFPEAELNDFTEGLYANDPTINYEEAQRRQLNWLLDQAGCEEGTRVLDIGCGNGELIKAAMSRRSIATGITISPAQASRCASQGLAVELADYRELDRQWEHRFDSAIANGSIEHFVQPRDFAAGRDDSIYREFFGLCHRLIDPMSATKRLVTTVIHRHIGSPRIALQELEKGPFSFRWLSGKFHYAVLQQSFGGFYPMIGQLEKCASPYFRAVNVVDGTDDYRTTSEECFRRLRSALFSTRSGPRIWSRSIAQMAQRPRQTLIMWLCAFITESWQWQFRGDEPPTRLLRHTWECCE